MGFLMGHSAWQIDQFPTCWPMNGLFVHWSRGWGVSSFSERLVVIGRIHWGRIMHICVSKLSIIGSNNGLSPGLQWHFHRNSYIFIQGSPFENVVWKMAAILPLPQYVNKTPFPDHSLFSKTAMDIKIIKFQFILSDVTITWQNIEVGRRLKYFNVVISAKVPCTERPSIGTELRAAQQPRCPFSTSLPTGPPNVFKWKNHMHAKYTLW